MENQNGKFIWDMLNRRHVLITIICLFFGPTGNCSIPESIVLIAAVLQRKSFSWLLSILKNSATLFGFPQWLRINPHCSCPKVKFSV